MVKIRWAVRRVKPRARMRHRGVEMRQWRAECLDASYCYSRSSPQYWNLVFASPKLARGACRRAGSQRARISDRADGELPLQDSNLDYLIQSRALGDRGSGQLGWRRSLAEHGCPLHVYSLPALARRNGSKTVAGASTSVARRKEHGGTAQRDMEPVRRIHL